jgi:hypothetical protein
MGYGRQGTRMADGLQCISHMLKTQEKKFKPGPVCGTGLARRSTIKIIPLSELTPQKWNGNKTPIPLFLIMNIIRKSIFTF